MSLRLLDKTDSIKVMKTHAKQVVQYALLLLLSLTLTVPVTTIDALRHFETG